MEPSPADVRLDVISGTLGADGARDCVFDSGGPWRLYRLDDGWLFQCFSSSFGLSPYKTARLELDFSSGQIGLDRRFVAQAASVDPLEYPLDELLFISLLGQGRGVEIHGCGVVDRELDRVSCSSGSQARARRRWRACGSQRILRLTS